MKLTALRDYARELTAFSLNARLYIASVFAVSVGLGIYSLIFNLYLVEIGYDTVLISQVLAMTPLAVALVSLPLGLLTDRAARLPVMIGGFAVIAVGVFIQALVPVPAALYGAGFIYGLGMAAFEITWGPFLTDSAPPRQRTQLFSIANVVFFVGMALGQVAGAFVPNLLPDSLAIADRYRLALAASALISALSVGPLLRIRDQRIDATDRPRLGAVLRGLRGVTGKLATLSATIGLTVGLANPFFNLYFVEHLGASREQFGIISSLVIIPNVLAPLASPAVGRRWGNLVPWVIGRTSVGLLLIVMALTMNVAVAAVAFLVRWFLVAFAVPLYGVFQMELIDPRVRAAVNALFIIAFYVAMTAGTAVAGWLIDARGYPAPLLAAAAFHAVLGVLAWLFFGRRPTPTSSE